MPDVIICHSKLAIVDFSLVKFDKSSTSFDVLVVDLIDWTPIGS